MQKISGANQGGVRRFLEPGVLLQLVGVQTLLLFLEHLPRAVEQGRGHFWLTRLRKRSGLVYVEKWVLGERSVGFLRKALAAKALAGQRVGWGFFGKPSQFILRKKWRFLRDLHRDFWQNHGWDCRNLDVLDARPVVCGAGGGVAISAFVVRMARSEKGAAGRERRERVVI